MKKFLRLFAILSAVLLLCACMPQESEKRQWTITYTANNFSASNLTAALNRELDKDEQSEITLTVELGYRFLGWSDGVKTLSRSDDKVKNGQTVEALFEYEQLDLPIISIETQDRDPIVSKKDYLNCAVTVSGAEEEYCMTDATAQIRGRGNTSWQMPKKSYRVKFSAKTNLFGNGAAKSWTLIANHADKSLMRNNLAYALGRELEDSLYTTTARFIDLYVNGEYLGVYLVCEQTEAGKTRVDVEDIALNPADSGYLIEMDGAPDGTEGEEFFIIDDLRYEIKDPDFEDEEFTSAHREYIADYMTRSYESLSAEDWSLVCSLIDVESFADTYIINELFNNADCGQKSVYFYKKANGPLCSGPLWDYDVSAGNIDYAENCEKADYLYAAEASGWYKGLLQFEEFRGIVSEKLQKYRERFISIIETGIENARQMECSANRNFEKWQIMGKYVWPNPSELVAITTWEGQVKYLKDWLLESWDYMYSIYVG